MAYQAPLNGGRINASITGNTAGAGALISTGTMYLAGGNNVTLSQNANSISINAGGGGTMSMYALGNTTQNSSATMDVRSVSLNGIGGLTAGYSNGSVQLSAPVVSSVSATGALSISVNGSTVSMGVPAFSGGMSNLGNTSGSTGIATNGLYLAGGNNVTLSQSTNGGTAATITISAAAQTNQTANFYISSNSTQVSSTAGVDLRSVTFQGAGGASFGLSQGKVLVSVNSTYAASNHSHGNPTLALTNISGTTASASNGLTLSLSAASQTVQTQSNIQGIIASGSTNRTGDISFANSNGVTFGLSNNTVTASVAAGGGGGVALYDGANSISSGTARVSATGALTASINGQTLNLSAPVVSSLSATGAVSISNNGGTISIGAPVQTNQTVGLYGRGNTTQNSSTTLDARTMSLNGLGAMSVGYSNGSVQLSAPAVSQLTYTGAVSMSSNGSTVSIGAPVQTNQTLGISATSNTFSSSNGTVDARSLYLRGVGAASVGISNGSILISAPNAAAGNVTFSAGTASNGLGSLVFSNSNGVSFGLNGSTITASAAGGGGGGFALYDGANSISSGTASISANGALTASINAQTLSLSVPATSSLVGVNGITVSTNGSTISISGDGGGGGGMPTLSRWEHPQQFTSLPGGFGQNILSIQHVYVPFNVTATAGKIGGSVSAGTHTSASTGNITMNLLMGIYTLSGSTLSLITQSSGSASVSFAISSNSTLSVNAMRQITAPMNINMTPGEYWVGALMNTSTNFASNPLSMTMYGNNLIASANNNAILSPLGVHSTASQRDALLFQGLYSTTISSMPVSISGGHINNTASSAVQRAGFYHAFFNATY